MGSLIQNTVFGKSRYKINTYIGAVADVVKTPELLSTKLGISVNRIKFFRIIGNNLECSIIGGIYNFPHSSWLLSAISYYIDNDGLATNDTGRTFRSATSLQKIKLNGLKTIGDESLTNTSLIEISLPNVTTLKGGFGSFRINPYLKRVILPEATFSEWSYSGIDSCTSLEIVYIPKLAVLRSGGSAALNNFVFSGSKYGFKIYASPLAQTSYLGGVDKDIAWAIANRGAIVRYVTDFTKPENVTNLSVTSSYNTGFKLNFTPPNSVNGIDFYEVYANGIYQHDIKGPNDIVAGLEKNTNYDISIIAVDNFYNKSNFSNTTNVSTSNLDLDLDAQKFLDVSLNHDLGNIVNNLVTSLKNSGLWNKMYAIYPLIGNTPFQHKFNLKNPQDTNAAFRLVFNGSGNHSSNGYQTNGTNAYANTNIIVNSIHTFSNAGLTMVCGTNNTPVTTNSFDLGAQKKSTPWEAYQIHLNHGASKNNNIFVLGTIGISKTAINDARGIHTVSKTTDTEVKYFKNKNLDTVASGTQTGVIPPLNYYIGCLNNGGGPFGYSNQRIQFTAFHEGLTESEVQTFHSIIDTFENNLNRKTW